MSAHGISFGKPKINIEQLREWKNGIVNQLTAGLKSMAKQRKVQIVTGVGEFLDQNHLCVTDAENKKLTLHFENAIIAVGSQPVKLPFLPEEDRKSTRLNSSHKPISYAVFCLKKKTTKHPTHPPLS